MRTTDFAPRRGGWWSSLFGALLFLTLSARAQTTAPPWTGALQLVPAGNNASVKGQRVATGTTGEVYCAGQLSGTATFGTTQVAHERGLFVSRHDAVTGQTQWVVHIGTGIGTEEIVALAADPATGQVLVAGNATAPYSGISYTFGAQTFFSPTFVACLSPAGQWLWALPVPATVRAAVWDGTGGVWLGGSFGGTLALGNQQVTVTPNSSQFTTDLFVAHLSAAQQWDGLLAGGGTADDALETLAYHPATGTLGIGGRFRSRTLTLGSTTLTFATSSLWQGMVAQARVTGSSPAWTTSMAVGAGATVKPLACAYTPSGEFIVSGTSDGPVPFAATTTPSGPGSFVARLNPAGTQWTWGATSSGAFTLRNMDLTATDLWVAGSVTGPAAFGVYNAPGGPDPLAVAVRLDIATGQWTSLQTVAGASEVTDVAASPANRLTVVGQPAATPSFSVVIGGRPVPAGPGTLFLGGLTVGTAGPANFDWVMGPNIGSASASIEKVLTDAQGNFTVVGYYGRALTLGTTTLTAGGRFIGRCTAGGQWLWATDFPFSNTQASADGDVLVAGDDAGNAYVAGTFSGTLTLGSLTATIPGGRSGLCVVSLTPNGTWRWMTTSPYRRGSNLPASLAAGPNGHPTVVLFFTDTLTLGATTLVNTVPRRSRYDGVVARLDAATGQWQWVARTVGLGNEFLKDAAVDANGEVAIAGFMDDSTRFGSVVVPTPRGALVPCVARLSATGQWLSALGVTTTSIRSNVRVATSATGDLLLTGALPVGAQFGSYTLAGPGPTGTTTSFVAKAGGQPLQWQWATATPLVINRQSEGGPRAAIDAAGLIYLGGCTVNPAQPTQGSTPAIAQLDPAGQVRWTAYASGPGRVSSFALTSAGQPVVAGEYSAPLQFGATSLPNYSAVNGFIAAIGLAVSAPDDLPELPAAALWPNPARTTATLRLPAPAPAADLLLLDAQGRRVRTVAVPPGATEVRLPIAGLPAGLYLVRGAGVTQRLVVAE